MRTRSRTRSIVIWTLVAIVGAVSWAIVAFVRGEEISAAWLLFAALGSYAIAYRFYARFIAKKVLEVDDTRATPAERLDNAHDYQPTDRRVLFGHHDGILAALFAVLIIVVILDASRIWVRAIVSRRPLRTHEAPYVRSRLVATSGLIATAEERALLAGADGGAYRGDRFAREPSRRAPAAGPTSLVDLGDFEYAHPALTTRAAIRQEPTPSRRVAARQGSA